MFMRCCTGTPVLQKAVQNFSVSTPVRRSQAIQECDPNELDELKVAG